MSNKDIDELILLEDNYKDGQYEMRYYVSFSRMNQESHIFVQRMRREKVRG